MPGKLDKTTKKSLDELRSKLEAEPDIIKRIKEDASDRRD
jgi:hypothetical protein